MDELIVTDLNGCPQQITDLNDAIQQCKDYKEYYTVNHPFSEFDKRQQAYWEDLHEKLTPIEEKVNRRRTKN